MPFRLIDAPIGFLRQERLGSEAVYEIIAEDDDIVTAEVLYAPGLPRGTRVRLLAGAARGMKRSESAKQRMPTVL